MGYSLSKDLLDQETEDFASIHHLLRNTHIFPFKEDSREWWPDDCGIFSLKSCLKLPQSNQLLSNY